MIAIKESDEVIVVVQAINGSNDVTRGQSVRLEVMGYPCTDHEFKVGDTLTIKRAESNSGVRHG